MDSMPSYRYEFGRSIYDESKAELTVNGLTVDIQPQSLRILGMLLAHRGEIVSRQELEEQVWQGRHVGENVLASAITRLRASLGSSNAGLIEAIPRIGYRITGQVQRTVVGQDMDSELAFLVGKPVPGRPEFVLERMLAASGSGEVWLARHGKTQLERVFKFGVTAPQLRSLKREATLARVLQENLGARRDFVQIMDWHFETAPFFLESEYGGENLLNWSLEPAHLDALDQDERLSLFRQIGQAVAAAHSVAVIHKDLKPANVLISQGKAGWQLKLVDFGSGRLTDPERLRDLGLTQMNGPQTLLADNVSGSVLYMAPEILRGDAVSEASDVFALGVMLYQLVVGDLRRPMVPGWEREITDPILCGEIARATDGDPALRTASVRELLNRLADLPARHAEREREVAAQLEQARDRESAARARQRRPWVFGTIAALTLGLATTLYAYVQLQHSEKRLQHQNHTVDALNRFLADELIGGASPGLIGHPDPTVREVMLRAAGKIDSPGTHYGEGVHARLHAAMQRAFNRTEEYLQAIRQAELALAALAKISEPDPVLIDEVRLEYIESLNALARNPEVQAQLKLLHTSLQRYGQQPHEMLVRYWYVRGRVEESAYEWSKASESFAKASALLAQLPAHDEELENQVEHEYAESNRLGGNLPEAIARYRTLLNRVAAKYGAESTITCTARTGLAGALIMNKETAEGLPLGMQALNCGQAIYGNQSGRYATVATMLAEGYVYEKKWAQAAEWNRKAVDIYTRINGEASLETLVAKLNLADCLQKSGQVAQVPALHRDIWEGARKSLPERHPLRQASRYYVAADLLDQGQAKGVAELLEGLDAKVLFDGDQDPAWEGLLSYEHGRLHLLQGDKATGIAELEKAATELNSKAPEDRQRELKNIGVLLGKVRK
ncbi:winged helix-turn-helix domain-containing protein [Burkholderiaceae bacterium DAT-1]|nr:winged helix-turn-helix domain-containing protein [Burkholderiaceae bacterium DAT-1]